MITEYRSQLQIVPLSVDEEVEEHRICVCVRKRPINAKGKEEEKKEPCTPTVVRRGGVRVMYTHNDMCVVRAVKGFVLINISTVLSCKSYMYLHRLYSMCSKNCEHVFLRIFLLCFLSSLLTFSLQREPRGKLM